MKYILGLVGILLFTYPITSQLLTINVHSVRKNLKFLFKPIPIKRKWHKIFYRKWTFGLFECDNRREISLMVFLLLPFHLLMFALILAYMIMLFIVLCTANENLLYFAYEKYSFALFGYMLVLKVITDVATNWARARKNHTPIKEQIESVKEADRIFKQMKEQKWRHLLSNELFKKVSYTNPKKNIYWFEECQIPSICEMVLKSSKNAAFDLIEKPNEPTKFVVRDITDDYIVFEGVVKKETRSKSSRKK